MTRKLARDCKLPAEIEDENEQRICTAIARDARALFTLVVDSRGQIVWKSARSERHEEHLIDSAERCVRLGLARLHRVPDSFNANRAPSVVVTAKVAAAHQLQRIFEKYPNVSGWMREKREVVS